MTKQTICVFTCVKDAAWSIEGWYDNIKEHADQIVIQDGGSTDDTRKFLFKIANEDKRITLLLEKEETEKFDWNEEVVRNKCLGLFKTDWILLQDSDELIEDKFWEWFRSTNHNAKVEKIGYYIAHQNLWLQKDQFNINKPWYPDYTLRLFRNHRGFFWVGKQHGSLWRMNSAASNGTGMCNPNDKETPIANTTDPIHFVHYHRAEKGYYNAVMNDKTLHHSDEKRKIDEQPILARLRQHPTGAGKIKRRFDE